MPDVSTIPFSRPFRTGTELERIDAALTTGLWQGDGPATARASGMIERLVPGGKVLLTTSCTHALEMAAMVCNLGPGDEVVVPSFTFPSTASAIAVRGATPVFVDIDPSSLNLNPHLVEDAINDKTRAIFVVHYAGVATGIDALLDVAERHNVVLVEDNAHGLGARWRGQPLGTFGTMATQSFHATKNVSCGEGGALVINDETLVARAEVIREKGTNRASFLRGQVDKYTWVDSGSSYLPADLLAAVLEAQLENFDHIQHLRREIWNAYHEALGAWAVDQQVAVMHVPPVAEHPAHMYYLILPTSTDQGDMLEHLRARNVNATFHYQPLHSSPAGRLLGRAPRQCQITDEVSSRLVRLPLFAGMTGSEVERVIEGVTSYGCNPRQ